MKPDLIFSDQDAERVELLRHSFLSHPHLTARLLKPDQLMALPGLHAFYLSITAAERWGALPIVHRAQVLVTTGEDQKKGWPPFIIASGAFRPEEVPIDPKFMIRSIVGEVLEAVIRFNAERGDIIRNVGIGADWIGLDDVPALDAAQIICSTYDEILEQT